MPLIQLIIGLLFTLGFVHPSWALQFSRELQAEHVIFHYQWQDDQEQTQQLSFQLPRPSLFQQFRHFHGYKPQQAQAFIMSNIKQQLEQQPLEQVQAEFYLKEGLLQLKLHSTSKQKLSEAEQKVAELQQQYLAEYLKLRRYQQFVTPTGEVAIKPDHLLIAKQSVDMMQPIREQILTQYQNYNIREITNYVLHWIQSIPYNKLESRVSSSGAGFLPPVQLLYKNQGDCDSKVTLTAAILRSLMPRIEIALVFIDNHALIGLQIPSLTGEATINVDGLQYVLAEPTGPALYPLGQIAPMSKQATDNELFVAQIMKP